MLHSVLSKLPQSLDLDGLIAKTAKLYEEHPPHKLPFLAWYKISSNSVLKTTLSLEQRSTQTLDDGQLYFDKHATELRRQESIQRLKVAIRPYKKPAGTLALAVGVALLSYWVRNDPRVLQALSSRLRASFGWH